MQTLGLLFTCLIGTLMLPHSHFVSVGKVMKNPDSRLLLPLLFELPIILLNLFSLWMQIIFIFCMGFC